MGSNLKFILKRPQHDLMWHCPITVFLIWLLSVPKRTLQAPHQGHMLREASRVFNPTHLEPRQGP